MPTLEEAEAYNVEVAKAAMMKMIMERKAAEEQQAMEQQKALDERRGQAIKELSDKVKAQNLIQQITEQNLGSQMEAA